MPPKKQTIAKAPSGKKPSSTKANVKAKENPKKEVSNVNTEKSSMGGSKQDIVDTAFEDIRESILLRDGGSITKDLIDRLQNAATEEEYNLALHLISNSNVPTTAEIQILRETVISLIKNYKELRKVVEDQQLAMKSAIEEVTTAFSSMAQKQELLDQTLDGDVTLKKINPLELEKGCRACQHLDHPVSRCKIFPTAESRRLAFTAKGKCLVCSIIGHSEAECPNNEYFEECKKCHQKHFRGLCITTQGAKAIEERRNRMEEEEIERKKKLEEKVNEMTSNNGLMKEKKKRHVHPPKKGAQGDIVVKILD